MVWPLAPQWLKGAARRPLPISEPELLRRAAASWRARLGSVAVESPETPLHQTIDHLDHDLARKPRVAILGEFNAGKTTLTNILARTTALDTHVLANTRVATLVHHAEVGPEPILVPVRRPAGVAGNAIALPAAAPFEYEALASRAELLHHCTILDTPGLSDPTHAEQIGGLYARIADIAVWCSIASHCWRESERQAWDSFSGRLRRYGVLVLTGADAVPGEAERERIRQRLRRDAEGRFGRIVFLAANEALRALDPDTGAIVDRRLWQVSGAAETEETLRALVTHVAAQRALRSRRWGLRLIRRLSATPHAQLGAAWWLSPLVTLSDRLRATAMSVRARRLPGARGLDEAERHLAMTRQELTSKLARLGCHRQAEQVEASFAEIGETLRRAGTGSEAALGESISAAATRLFHEIAGLMRSVEQETAAIAEFERHLLTLVGGKNGRRTARTAFTSSGRGT